MYFRREGEFARFCGDVLNSSIRERADGLPGGGERLLGRMLFLGVLLVCSTAISQVVGPPKGTLLAAGGNIRYRTMLDKVVELAGGDGARIVIIPTALREDDFGTEWPEIPLLLRAGATQVTVLHTRSRTIANSEDFVRPLLSADGVWFSGGRQWRLVDAYLGTRTQEALASVLERGGVIAGSSAGASILASYLVRGSPSGNQIMMAPGYEEGFGFLKNAAIDQHLLARGRERDLVSVVTRHPELLGIGIDENTAIIVRGDILEVFGASKVGIFNPRLKAGGMPSFLNPGDRYDLGRREELPAVVTQP